MIHFPYPSPRASISPESPARGFQSPCLRAAFGGGALEGRKLVRFIFKDEGGISGREPFVVVAGIFVHADEQLVPLEEKLEELVRKHIPKEYQQDFFFHASDIWSGVGKIFKDRERWPLPKRLSILRDLARVPRKLDIPIVYAAIERSTMTFAEFEIKPSTPHERNVATHALAFAASTVNVEGFMRNVWPDEVAQLVAEDNNEVRRHIKGVHEIFRNPYKVGEEIIPHNFLPLRKIRGPVHFANKTESRPLQMADLCAFVIRGHLAKHPHNGPLYNLIKPMMLVLPKGEEYRGPKVTVAAPYLVDDV